MTIKKKSSPLRSVPGPKDVDTALDAFAAGQPKPQAAEKGRSHFQHKISRPYALILTCDTKE